MADNKNVGIPAGANSTAWINQTQTVKDLLSGSAAERAGQLAGLRTGEMGYGQSLPETADDIQRVKDLQRQRTNNAGGDPVSAAIMGQKAESVANAKRTANASGVKGGASIGALGGVERSANSDIAASLYGQQANSLADERSLASNTLAGITGLMYGEKAANVKAPDAPKSSGMSVICTELYRQGIMPLELYLIDTQKGVALSLKNPDLMVGYHWFGIPLAKRMATSPLLTKILTVPAMAWANQMAGRKNLLGWAIYTLGVPVCTLLGKIKNRTSGELYV